MYVLLTVITALFISYHTFHAVRRLYFHPLSTFRGPKLWIAFPIFRQIYQCLGTFDRHMLKFHGQYGEVVRFADDSLSFTTAQAWKDIYGYGHGHTQWQKLQVLPPQAPPSIVFSNDRDHARFRKALGHAFSEGALRLQEDLIKGYVDLLIVGLKDEAKNGNVVDMTMWYNLTTFDIIADLAFGEPSHCLENKAYSPFVINIFKFAKLLPFLQLAMYSPFVWNIIRLFSGRSMKRTSEKMMRVCNETVTKRKNDRTKDGRGDFFESMLKYEGTKDEIADLELVSNANILFMAGSETTATLLAGVTYWMLRTPETMKKAIKEVREAFTNETEITFSSASTRLPYMLACLEEALRVYPPVPTILLRGVPEPSTVTVSGHTIPPGTYVGVHQMGSNRSPQNFHRPDEFLPERWLPEAINDTNSPFHNDNRDARQPFSLGPRNCIGKNLAFSEMRQIFARVLWNFDLELVDGGLEWTRQKAYNLWDKGPLPVRIRVRAGREGFVSLHEA